VDHAVLRKRQIAVGLASLCASGWFYTNMFRFSTWLSHSKLCLFLGHEDRGRQPVSSHDVADGSMNRVLWCRVGRWRSDGSQDS